MRTRLLGAVLLFSGVAFSQTMPDGKGKAEFMKNCTACHTPASVVQARKTPADWKKTVDDMVSRGASGTDEEMATIVAYLSANFGTDKPAAPAAAPAPAASTGSPETDRARKVIAANACMGCHRIDKEGGYMGPALNGVGTRRNADSIRMAILHPNPKLDPAHNLVQLTTADGKAVFGRIVSQNDAEIRVIDASGLAIPYQKAGLKSVTMMDSNPMPSYDGKIAGEDLDSLVKYLSKLPDLDAGAQK